jgi:hypothetical protein
MRHALAHEIVGYCQICDEALTSRDVLETGQAKFCPDCYHLNSRNEIEELQFVRAPRSVAR